MTILDDKVVLWSDATTNVHLSELDSVDRIQIKGDTSYLQEDGSWKYHIAVKGDSVFQSISYRDTIFTFSSGDILRKFKGYYFLNDRTVTGRWMVWKLDRTKDGATLGSIVSSADFNKLEAFSGKRDSNYTVNPQRKEFKKFINDDGFTDVVYIRINDLTL